MDKTTARKTVLVSTGLLLAISIYREKSQPVGFSYFKRLWGVGVISMMLSVTADFAPQVAGPFAALLVLGSLTTGGDKAIQNALATVSTKAPAQGGSK